MLRWIGFDGELANGANIFLRGNGHTEGGIAAESLPIAGGGADIGMAEKHGDGLALERAGEGAGGFSWGGKWIVDHDSEGCSLM